VSKASDHSGGFTSVEQVEAENARRKIERDLRSLKGVDKKTEIDRRFAEYKEARIKSAAEKMPYSVSGTSVLIDAVDCRELHCTLYVEPIGKPRATQRDKWKPSPAVQRYRNWCDKVRAQYPSSLIPAEPLQLSLRAFFSLPASWSKKKKGELRGELHRQCPDADNIAKAVMDAFWKQDSGIAVLSIEKRWDDGGGARIEMTVE